MNINEKCLLNYLSDYSDASFDAAKMLIKFLSGHNKKIEFNNLNPVYNIIDEMEFQKELSLCYEQKNLD